MIRPIVPPKQLAGGIVINMSGSTPPGKVPVVVGSVDRHQTAQDSLVETAPWEKLVRTVSVSSVHGLNTVWTRAV
ncbi:hypothetical protein ES702_06110 [subsurface metagenome]